MNFTIPGLIRNVATIAAGPTVRLRAYLSRRFGQGKWRKMKGVAEVRYPDGSVWLAELHWYEAHGIGKRLLKIRMRLERL